jgi:biotin carboxyl carrier protein
MAVVDVPAPMTGSVVEVLVAVGQQVSEAEELLILESMKMEVPLESPVAGTITEILVAPADQIEEGQLLLRIER